MQGESQTPTEAGIGSGDNTTGSENIQQLFTKEDVESIVRQQLAAKALSDPNLVKLPRLKSEGLQRQADCLVDLEKCLVKIGGAICEETGVIDGDLIQVSVQEGRSLIHDRQKRLKIADEGGWQAVSIYDGASSIGDDASDSKAIQKAIDQAKSNTQARRSWKLRGNGRYSPYGNQPANWETQPSMAPRTFGRGGYKARTPGSYAPKMETGPFQGKLRWDQCSRCFAIGHWAKDCQNGPGFPAPPPPPSE